MSYSVAADIESEFKSLSFSASGSGITTAEVTEYIAQEDAAIESILSRVYVVPITGTTALSIVKKISIDRTAFRVAKILNMKKSLPIPDQLVAQELNEGAAYLESEKLLRELQAGTASLIDAPRVGDTAQGLSSYNATNGITPTFERGVDQW